MGSVYAFDPDERNSVLYYITSGNSDGRFWIVINTGDLLVRKDMDYESASSCTLKLEARDGKENGVAAATAHISVTDVDE